jgi:DNA-cytosine methyltransferase
MKAITLFSGIGGFDIALESSGVTVDTVCEIDKNAQSVLRRHFPNSKLIDDVRKVGLQTHAKRSIDIICGGFPCQDLSIAGKREGLSGERSGLWFEFARVIDELEPRWVIIENVPGLLSSNKGKDIQIVIDTLTQMGYTCDIEIKDAQEFGVPQRRRRVFITCVRLDDLLSKRTILSKQISADLLAQILLHTWGAIQPVSFHVALHSDFEKPIERCVNLLNKMTGLLNKTRERLAFKKYQNNLDVLLDQFGAEGKNLMSGLIKKSEIQKAENSGKTVMFLSDLKTANGDMSISLWLSNLLEGVCEAVKVSTISTSKNLITDHQIYIYSAMVLLIIERILLSTEWSLSYWNAAQLFSTLIQENMNYARTASSELFIESGLRDSWRDYLSSASDIKNEIDNRIRIIRAAEILFEPESMPGNTPPSRETGEGIADTFTIRSGKEGGGKGYLGQESSPMTLGGQPQYLSFARQRTDEYKESEIVDTISQRDYKSATDLILDDQGGSQMSISHNVVPTLRASVHGHQPLVAWEMQHASEAYRETQGGIATSVQSRMGTGGNNVPLVGIRRLTPLECERLQGFEDGWTDGQSDSARYKQLGNAVAVPVVKWIINRIVEANQ